MTSDDQKRPPEQAESPAAEGVPYRTLKLELEYDGTEWEGWQLQPGRPTLQGVLEERLERILGSPHRVHAAGRTDSGVHARGQVVHLKTAHPMAAAVLQKALNATLPRDIVVCRLEEVPEGFHARFSRHHKRYVYQLWTRKERSPFLERYAWHFPHRVEWQKVREAALLLVGTHDFAAFRASDCGARTTVRHISRLELEQHSDGLVRIVVEGNGFLKHMVRTLVGTLLEVGQNRRTLEQVTRALETGVRAEAGKTAPARGLWLEKIWYSQGTGDGGSSLRSEAEGDGSLGARD